MGLAFAPIRRSATALLIADRAPGFPGLAAQLMDSLAVSDTVAAPNETS